MFETEEEASSARDKVIQHFNSVIENSETYLSPASNGQSQLNCCYELDALQHQASRLKDNAIHLEKEEIANLFLGFECVIGAVRAELMMWLFLKKENAKEAWDQLISSQMACLDATRADEGFSNCLMRLQRLQHIEEIIFPPQSFVSVGFIAQTLECSICNQRYGSCRHLRGLPYMGKFCEVIHHGIEVHHVALVDRPADKRCRVLSLKTADGYRDKISGNIIPYDEGEAYEDDGMLVVRGLLLSTDRYPYLTTVKQILETVVR